MATSVAALENSTWGAEPQSWRAREREPIMGVWGRSPQRGPGTEPLVTGSGCKAPEAKEVLVFGRPITPMKAENLHYSLYFSVFK